MTNLAKNQAGDLTAFPDLARLSDLFSAEHDLLEIRLAALRHTADFDDPSVIADTESLSARFTAWNEVVTQAVESYSGSLEVLLSADFLPISIEPTVSVAKTDYRHVAAALEAEIAEARKGLHVDEARKITAGYDADPVFRYLAAKRASAEKNPDARLSAGDRWLSSVSSFERARVHYDEAKRHDASVLEWIERAEAEVSRLDELLRKERDSQARIADMAARQATSDKAVATAERAWFVLMELLDTECSEFERLDTALTLAIARETAAATARASVTGEPSETLAFLKEQEECLDRLASAYSAIRPDRAAA